MGLFDFVEGIGSGLSRGLSGLGNLARGRFGDALSDLGGAAKGLAPVLSFVPGVGTLGAAGIGALGGLMSGGLSGEGAKAALQGGLGGAMGIGRNEGLLKLGLGRLGGLGSLLGGGGGISGAMDGTEDIAQVANLGGRQSTLGNILSGAGRFLGGDGSNMDAIRRLGGLGLGIGGILDSRSQRASAEAFQQKQLDTLMAALAKGEAQFDARAPLRDAGMQMLLSRLSAPSLIASQVK